MFKHFEKSPYILHLKWRRSNLYVLGVEYCNMKKLFTMFSCCDQLT